MKLRYLYIFLVSLTMFGCSSSKPGEEALQIEIDVTDLHSWLNLMPGNPGKFYLLGEVSIANTGSEVIEELKLDKIRIYSGKELVYSFYPFFNLKNLNEVNLIEPDNSKEYTFGIDSGLNIDERLMSNNIIDVEMKFISGSDFFILKLNKITVEQAF